MTAIVGLVESKSVYIGGDSAGVSGMVAEAADGYAAVGCGDRLALGALFATAGTGLKPRRRVLRALAAAERFSAGVRGPFVCLKTP